MLYGRQSVVLPVLFRTIQRRRISMHQTLAESIVSANDKKNIICASEEVLAKSCSKFLNQQQKQQQLTVTDGKQEILIRSQSDKFDYKLLRLENGIRIFLISDPTYNEFDISHAPSSHSVDSKHTSDEEDDEDMTEDSDSTVSSNSSAESNSKISEKSSAVVVGVKVGSFEDPKEFQGLAHMLEHMITMGSKEFPAENEIDEFLSSRGGYQNACTECEHTIYEIKVRRQYVKEVINLLGHSFAAPLLRNESINKEIKPVDTEFFEAATDDDVRLDLLLSHLAESDHPMSHFMWGNRKSLITDPAEKGLDIRKCLVDFHAQHYTPENIVVVVQSQEPLKNLEEWTVNNFSKVPSQANGIPNSIKAKTHNLPFDGEASSRFNKLYLVESVNSGTRLLLSWCLPPVIQDYLSSPLDYLATLIGHEGKGSLIAELRKRDLAVDLVTDANSFCFKNNRECSIFTVDIYLTDGGSERLDDVVKLFFEYITVIRKTGAQEYFFLENQKIALKTFNLKSEKNPLSNSIEIVKNLMYYPVEHALVGNKVYYNYNKKLIDHLLTYFTPQKTNFMHQGGKFRSEISTQKEPWIGTSYQVIDVPTKWFDDAAKCTGLSDYFRYPTPNPFIADNFDLLNDKLPNNAVERKQTEFPTKIFSTDRMTVWHKPDFKFNLPKASINIHILNPCFENTLENVALSDVFFEYLMITLKEDAYDALVAELDWDLTRTHNGIYVKVNGFNQKLGKLVFLLLERFKTLEFDSTFVGSIKREVTKYYNNNYQESEIFNQQLRLSLLMNNFYTFLDRWPLIKSIDKEQLLQYQKQLLSNLTFDILVQGNMTINETLELSKQIGQMFGLEKQTSCVPYQKIKHRVRRLPEGTNRLRALTLSNKNNISFVVCYFQLAPFEMRSQCYLSLFVEMINELCFNVLRTTEGLGYRVGCEENDTFGILGFNLFVSTCAQKFDCTFIEGRIKEFVEKNCREYIDSKLDETKFKEFVSSAISKREAPFLNLNQEVERNMSEINSFDYYFERVKREAAQLKQANLAQFKQWTADTIFVPKDKQKNLVIQVVGNGPKSMEECITSDNCPLQESMIPHEGDDCKSLKLLQSKPKLDNLFILDVDNFKKQLELYPVQVSDIDR